MNAFSKCNCYTHVSGTNYLELVWVNLCFGKELDYCLIAADSLNQSVLLVVSVSSVLPVQSVPSAIFLLLLLFPFYTRTQQHLHARRA